MSQVYMNGYMRDPHKGTQILTALSDLENLIYPQGIRPRYKQKHERRIKVQA